MCAASRITHLNRSGMKAFSDGNLANAEFLLHQALRQARQLNSAAFEAKIRNNLGLVCIKAGRSTEAKEHFGHALEFIGNKIGYDSRLYRAVQSNLASASA
ncbi:tetratricopeptide repeat protein [Oleidesulfovibrio sp.]|uniref:tetratricopeptide repeat protein n=1 Tax=Oleidesulfovibrio sp. TaxID=2909707 RepID=UPI003A872898